MNMLRRSKWAPFFVLYAREVGGDDGSYSAEGVYEKGHQEMSFLFIENIILPFHIQLSSCFHGKYDRT